MIVYTLEMSCLIKQKRMQRRGYLDAYDRSELVFLVIFFLFFVTGIIFICRIEI